MCARCTSLRPLPRCLSTMSPSWKFTCFRLRFCGSGWLHGAPVLQQQTINTCQPRERSKRSTLATTTRCTGRRILSCGRREDDAPNPQLPPLVVSLEALLSGTLGKKLGSSLAFFLSFISFLLKIVNLFSEFPFFHVRQWDLEKSLEPMCGSASERSQIRHLLPVFGCLVPKGCGRQV